MHNHRPVPRPQHTQGPERSLDREFLLRLATRGRPSSVADLFEGFEPNWAMEAATRCWLAEFVTRDPRGVLTLTPAGEAEAKVGRAEANASAREIVRREAVARKGSAGNARRLAEARW